MSVLPCFLAAVLASSAVHKAREPERMGAAAERLAGAAAPMGGVLIAAAGAVEAVSALALVLPGTATLGAGLAAALWAGYGAALLARRGQVLDCGCDLVARPRPVGWGQILRAGLLSLLAVAVALLPPLEAGWPESLFGAAALLALYFSASEIMAIPAPRWRNS